MKQKKKYIITDYPVMIREAEVYAKDYDEAWEIYWGNVEGDIKFDDCGDLTFADVESFVDPEIYEDKQQKEVA